ncbi:carboxymuconolactone decarboxylase family protein [Actinocorallia libanotica]|uniref:Carboxymuconolactone decarboxylase family protein n=1 Tax=Actinocorallia libanotica TaxID=46162 RepID=A0ABP4AI25_9ACTN
MRVPPLPGDLWGEKENTALRGLLPRGRRNPEGAGVALSTLIRHPDLTEAFLGFNVYLLFRSTLPPRLRELAILRVARRCDCAYEWTHHAQMAVQQMGLTEAEVEAAGEGRADGALEQAVLRAVDELGDGADLSDATWAALSEHLDERQRMDLVFTIGAYTMLASAFNAFGVRPEHEPLAHETFGAQPEHER